MADSVLVVEDEELVADMVRLNLEHEGFAVTVVYRGDDGLNKLTSGRFDAVVLDLMLPGMDGFAVARKARDRGITTPILMLTARGETTSKVEGLEAGADDYLTKPFAMPELVARVRALIRRHTTARGLPTSHEVRFGPYVVNTETREATTNQGIVTLTETECALLTWLAAREGEPLSRADILENAWGMDRFPTERTVDNYVMRLRRLFEPDPDNPIYFLTIRGRGYRFVRG